MDIMAGRSHGTTVDDCIVRCALQTFMVCINDLAPHARNDVFWKRKQKEILLPISQALESLQFCSLQIKLKVTSLDDKYLAPH